MSKKIENTVKKQALLLEKEMPRLVKLHLGKFVAFFDGATLIEETHQICLDKAEKVFGRDRGFVINEVSTQPLFVSAIFKL